MSDAAHSHVFLDAGHAASERRMWAVIALCGAMMVAEIVGGIVFGSIALTADGLHMSTHAGALLLSALAYTYARRHADDPRFAFGTGKLGDLAGFASAIVLALIAALVAYEAITRLFAPVPIHFAQALPIACVGLAVNAGSAWLLGARTHAHHRHGHVHGSSGHAHHHHAAHRDNNMRAAVIHVMADAVVSALVIAGLLLALAFGWVWMDPLAGLVGAGVIASWSIGLLRDTGTTLLDMNPDPQLTDELRRTLEDDGDRLSDLHLWKLGPGHLGAIVSVVTRERRGQAYYRAKLARFALLSHLTVEVRPVDQV